MWGGPTTTCCKMPVIIESQGFNFQDTSMLKSVSPSKAAPWSVEGVDISFRQN